MGLLTRVWRWLAAGGAALVALLAGLWGLVHWRGEKARLNREAERQAKEEQRRLDAATATLARESERGQAALAEAHRQAAERAADGAGVERLHRRLSPPGSDS